jgi:hypothetical protein
LTAIGETSQLTAAAISSDGTEKDVTAETRWTSRDPSTMTISPAGRLTVMQLGASVIYALYMNVSANVPVRATPAGTFVINGWVREPGQGGVDGVTVTDTATLTTARTDSSGRYNLVGLPRDEAHLIFRKDGYEPAEIDATREGQRDGEIAGIASMQRIIRLRPGETLRPPRFAPGDFAYVIGSRRCFPCRLVRVNADRAGTYRVRITWDEPAVTISLWANGAISTGSAGELVADFTVPAGESIGYLGLNVPPPPGPVYHVPFTIETSIP